MRIFFFLLLISLNVGAQSQLDSILHLVRSTDADTVKLEVIATNLRVFRNRMNDYMVLAQTYDSIAVITQMDRYIGQAKVHIGNGHYLMQDQEQATKYLLEGAEYLKGSDDHITQRSLYNTLATISRDREEYDLAIDYYDKAKAKAQLEQDSLWMGIVDLNKGVTHIRQKDYERAQSMFASAKETFQELNQGLYAGYAALSLADVMQETDNSTAADTYAKEAMRLIPPTVDPKIHSGGNAILAKSALKKGRYSTAVGYFTKGLDIASQVGFNDHILECRKGLYDAHYSAGQYREASDYLKSYHEMRDSIFNSEKEERIAGLMTKFETEQKEAEIERLSLEDQLNEAQISRQRLGLWSMGAAVLLLGALLFSYLNQNKKITHQNGIITKANKEKEVLLKEIHHRVKNNLQVISSLLGLQSLSIKDEAAKNAIQEGRSRVHSMSLIHQNLYNKDNLSGIVMAPYIKKLCNDLVNTYQVGDVNITVYEDVQSDLMLDVETVVPLGLIINELVTNSMKYAFDNRDNGLISVTLKEDGKQLSLSVSDNGSGFDESQPTSGSGSFGYSLIRAFRDKLEADMHIDTSSGTAVYLNIKHYKVIS